MYLFDEMMRNDQYQTTQYLCIRRAEIMKLSRCNKAPIFLQRLARLKNLLHCCFETGNNLTVDGCGMWMDDWTNHHWSMMHQAVGLRVGVPDNLKLVCILGFLMLNTPPKCRLVVTLQKQMESPFPACFFINHGRRRLGHFNQPCHSTCL